MLKAKIDLSQIEIGEMVGVSKQTYSAIEKEENDMECLSCHDFTF